MKLGPLAISVLLLSLPCTTSCAQATHRASDTLTPFQSDAEILQYFRRFATTRARRSTAQLDASVATGAPVALASKAAADESITNTQHQGVDEGGIVKLHGDYLVMLRRGRLFTVNIGDRSLRPLAAV